MAVRSLALARSHRPPTMSLPSSSPSRPAPRPRRPGLRPGDTVVARQRARPARRHRVAPVDRRGRGRPRRRARPGSSFDVDVRQAGRPAARGRGVQRRLRPGPHVRQPLRVLLHLPAAEGPAPQPVPEGRRLPAQLPVRELHHADPVHRGRPRAGRHRAAVAAAREHPHHRPRPPGGDAAQPPRRHQPALAAGAARPRHRGARPDRRLSRRQRRRRPRRHAWPASSTSTRS